MEENAALASSSTQIRNIAYANAASLHTDLQTSYPRSSHFLGILNANVLAGAENAITFILVADGRIAKGVDILLKSRVEFTSNET